ncbi:MAG: hypothetical protein WAQ33_02390 [Gaiellaceae bacterium]
MPVGLGPRFLIEAGFIVAVAVVAGIERFSTATIILAVGAAWLLVAFVEFFSALARKRAVKQPATSSGRPAFGPAQQSVALQPEPEPAPEPDREPVSASEPAPAPEEPPVVEAPEPVPSPPRVVAVPPLPPEPAPVQELEPEVVSLASRRTDAREWNLWDLERVARDRAGADVARDEERTFLLMYLREFANADGVLPADFDAVVRESFGDVLDAAYS